MRSHLTWIVPAAALLLCACTEAPWPLRDFETVSVTQSPCLFNCPAFTIEIFADGRVRHSGPAFTHTGGAHESRIDRHGLTQIAMALRAARFDDLRERYLDQGDGCEHVFSDASTLSFTVQRAGRSTSRHLYTGCVGPNIPTARIDALVKAIDRVTGTGALLEQRKQPGQAAGTTERSR